MTATIVNLRQARKAKAKREAEAKAQENRILFGRTRSEKAAERDARDRAQAHLEGHRLEPGPDGPKAG